MRNLGRKFQSYWLADASFVTLLIMLITAVFVLPVFMEISGHGVLLFNVLLLSVFFLGIFSTRRALNAAENSPESGPSSDTSYLIARSQRRLSRPIKPPVSAKSIDLDLH